MKSLNKKPYSLLVSATLIYLSSILFLIIILFAYYPDEYVQLPVTITGITKREGSSYSAQLRHNNREYKIHVDTMIKVSGSTKQVFISAVPYDDRVLINLENTVKIIDRELSGTIFIKVKGQKTLFNHIFNLK